jgi:hypothetical protein
MTQINAKADLLMTGPLGTSIVNAASSQFRVYGVVNPLEEKITAAIAYAVQVGAKAVYVPDSLLPYNANLVTFNNAVKMFREGGNPAWYDVLAYGASGNASTDSTVAIQAAINAAANFVNDAFNNKRGATVYFPEGGYVYSATLQVPVITGGGITLKGAGMRASYLFPTGASTVFSLNSDGDRVCLVFGTLTPDVAGTFTNQTQYCGMEDLSQSGSSITSGSVVAHQITTMQYGWMRNSIIEAFPNSSIGLYLRGTTVTGGLGTGTSGPHVRLCNFINTIVTNIGSGSGTPIAVLMQNADENSFLNCTAAPATGLTGGGADTIFAVWVQLGRNNRWFGCLEQGDTTANKTNYAGWVLGPPQNRAGTPNGQVSLNQMYGDVLEGFDRAVWFQAEAGGNLRGNMAVGINPSIVNANYLDSNSAGSGFGNAVLAPNLTPPLNYFDGPQPSPSGNATFANLATTPSVAGNNVFACANGGATIITSFTNTTPNQLFWVRLDANTTIRDVNNGGGGDIQCWGRQDIVGQTNLWVPFLRLQSVPITYQVGHPLTIGNSGLANFQFPVIWANKFVALSEAVLVSGLGAAGSIGNYFSTTLTAARVVGAPLNPIAGQRITNTLIQNATGGWAVTWNAVFKNSWSDTGNTLNKRSTISHIYDGTSWNQDGAQTPYV